MKIYGPSGIRTRNLSSHNLPHYTTRQPIQIVGENPNVGKNFHFVVFFFFAFLTARLSLYIWKQQWGYDVNLTFQFGSYIAYQWQTIGTVGNHFCRPLVASVSRITDEP